MFSASRETEMLKHRFQELLCMLKLGQESASVCFEVAPWKLRDCKLHCHPQYARQFYYEVSSFLYTSGLLGRLFSHWEEGKFAGEI